MDDDQESESDASEGPKSRQIPTSKSSKRPPPEQEPSDDPTSALKKAREADKKKGQAVKKQIVRRIYLASPAF